MFYETFHALRSYAASHPEEFHHITEKEFRQKENVQPENFTEKSPTTSSSLPDGYCLCISASGLFSGRPANQ